jgi:hypothetical protein
VSEALETRDAVRDEAPSTQGSERYELEDFFDGASPLVSGLVRLVGLSAVLTALWLVLRWPFQWL